MFAKEFDQFTHCRLSDEIPYCGMRAREQERTGTTFLEVGQLVQAFNAPQLPKLNDDTSGIRALLNNRDVTQSAFGEELTG